MSSPAVLPARFAALALALGAAQVDAHHSFGAIYDNERQITVEGIVTEFAFVHPHPMLYIVDDASRQWRLEMDNRFELADIGMTAETFKAGDRVVVSGNAGRAQAQNLYLRSLVRSSDGLRYQQLGSTPEISRPEGTR
jgi:hypothetical protein